MEAIRVTYSGGHLWSRRVVNAVRDVSLSIAEGETVGLVGESGSGKTTLGRVSLGVTRPTEGHVRFAGEAVTGRRERLRGQLSVVMQQPEWALNPRLRVGVSVAEPLDILGRVPGSERQKKITAMLEMVGLDESFATRYPHELSGGQRQRVAIARALITSPRFVVFDEAVSALDVSVQTQVLNLIKSLQASRGFASLFISHDLAATRYVSNRIAVMYAGEIVEMADAARFYARPEHAYSRALFETVV
jgi:ABC-type glutathione transport system ATPase component